MIFVVATITCDRKSYSHAGIMSNAEQAGDNIFHYLNVQTDPFSVTHMQAYGRCEKWKMLGDLPGIDLGQWAIDMWGSYSSWHKKPSYDQDQSRLFPIVIARNMALSYARHIEADAILFIDSDVQAPADTLKRLLATEQSIVGALIPGRGAHSHVKYVFNMTGETCEAPNGDKLIRADGSCGCMLIRRNVFEYLSFRFGRPEGRTDVTLSEDPAYLYDAKKYLGKYMWINTAVVCDHVDSEKDPLTSDQTARYPEA